MISTTAKLVYDGGDKVYIPTEMGEPRGDQMVQVLKQKKDKNVLKQTGKLAPADKPWLLIEQAIADLKKQERCKRVRIDMGVWHSGRDRIYKQCEQCLAGCVISRRLGVSLNENKEPGDFGDHIDNRLYALNSFRIGELQSAYHILGVSKPLEIPPDVAVVCYDMDKTLFKKQMLRLAKLLRKAHQRAKMHPKPKTRLDWNLNS